MSYNATSLINRTRRARLLQETHLAAKHNLFLSGMKIVRRDNGVGTAIGVNGNIKCERVQIDLTAIDYTAVRIKCKMGMVLVVSINVPCHIKR